MSSTIGEVRALFERKMSISCCVEYSDDKTHYVVFKPPYANSADKIQALNQDPFVHFMDGTSHSSS